MDWPAKSPDLSPVEHAWDALGKAVATRQPPHPEPFRSKNCSEGGVGVTSIGSP